MSKSACSVSMPARLMADIEHICMVKPENARMPSTTLYLSRQLQADIDKVCEKRGLKFSQYVRDVLSRQAEKDMKAGTQFQDTDFNEYADIALEAQVKKDLKKRK